LERAEAYVVDLFQRLGLKEPGSVYDFKKQITKYEHPVEIISGVDADWANSILKADWRHLKAKEEFAPAGFSSVGEIKGEVVDVGYGIMAPELGLDDYANKKTQGKVVLIRRRIPAGLNLTASQESNYGDLKYKTFVAREKGAKAVIFWEPEGDEKKTENLSFSLEEADGQVSTDAGLPVMFVSRKIAREWLAAPKPVVVSGNVSLKKKKTTSNNIIGFLGNESQCRKQSPIVIGAHLDHLGNGRGGNSLDTSRGTHYGADDNASGVAAIIEAARLLKANSGSGCYLFVAFTGEEIGLVGSSRLVEAFKKAESNPRRC
jgi:Iap family predicted aminopeptidase